MPTVAEWPPRTVDRSTTSAEVWSNVLPPASGMDVYRVLSLPTYQGALVPTVIFVEFEKQ